MQNKYTHDKPILGRTAAAESEDLVENPNTITMGYCINHVTILVVEEKVNCKVPCSYKAIPLVPDAQSSARLSMVGRDRLLHIGIG